MNIVLMRAQSNENDQYIQQLGQLGNVTCIPVLDFAFVNLVQLKLNLESPENWSGLILTSKRAVESIQSCSKQNKLDEKWKSKSCYVVGEETAKCAEQLGSKCCGQKTGNAENLANLIIQEKKKLQNLPLLFPCGQLKRDILPKLLHENDIAFTPITTYLTIEHPNVHKNVEDFVENNQFPTHIVFFSPSGYKFCFETWKKVLGENIHKVKFVTIGPTTASAFTENNIQVLTAKSPTPSSICDVINSNC